MSLGDLEQAFIAGSRCMEVRDSAWGGWLASDWPANGLLLLVLLACAWPESG